MAEPAAPAIREKWRPTLGLITSGLIASVLVLPLVGLMFFRLYENQLLRQTESELIAQAAMLAAVYARDIEAAPEGAFPIGAARPPMNAQPANEPYAPMPPALDLATSPILTRRAPARLAAQGADARAFETGAGLGQVLEETQRTTLAGFRLTDSNGVVIAGRDEIGLSLAHVEEVRAALSGRAGVVLRQRVSDEPAPPLYSISRGARIRVFVAMPVFVEDRVRGAVLISRTPDNIVRSLYRERRKVALAGLLMIVGAALIGAVFVRTISRPLRDLVARADSIARGARDAIGPLKWHGTAEVAHLTQSFMGMARRLSDRSDYLSTFASHVTHELKTPLTAIKGAVELLRDGAPAMSAEERTRFLDNILADSARMSVLLDRLRELARADNADIGGVSALGDVVAAARANFQELELALDLGAGDEGAGRLAMSRENALMVLGHLLDNARRHGASRVAISAREEGGRVIVRVADDGKGVSAGNRARIFEPFFTTRREEDGAGMGLVIARALLRAHGGDIQLSESTAGAAFELELPALTARTPRRFGLGALWARLRRG
jgi:signal transduction histidine kinase